MKIGRAGVGHPHTDFDGRGRIGPHIARGALDQVVREAEQVLELCAGEREFGDIEIDPVGDRLSPTARQAVTALLGRT